MNGWDVWFIKLEDIYNLIMSQLTIFRSSAGSGKTLTLVLYYLQIALKQPDSDNHILAITFTNKATEEMKSRLINTLAAIAAGNEQIMTGLLTELTRLEENEIRQRSSRLLKRILHSYAELSIMTIDSFFNRLIRPIARELGISVNREIELDYSRVIRDVKHRLFSDIGKDQETTNLMTEFISGKMDDKGTWKADKEIEKLILEIIQDYDGVYYREKKAITVEFIARLKEIQHSFKNTLNSHSIQFHDFLNKNNIEVSDLYNKGRGPAGWFLKAAKGSLTKDDINESVKRACVSGDNWFNAKSKLRDQISEQTKQKLVSLLQDSVQFFSAHNQAYVSADAVLKLIYMAGLTDKLKQKLNQYRDEREILLLSDISRLVSESLTINDTEFIFEKAGSRYMHILVDEFQDTSEVQWKNLKPLVINSLASGGNVLIVGDAKQSIYRWRGGKAELLLSGIRQELKQFEKITVEKELTVNYRSSPGIVEFNNLFFSQISNLNNELLTSEPSMVPLVYQKEKIVQKVGKKDNYRGLVEVKLLKTDKQEATLEIRKQALAERMIESIRQSLEDGFSHRDIAILVRKGDDAALVTSKLFEKGIRNVISAESLLASQSDQVQLLVFAMKLIDEPDNEIARAGLLTQYFKNTNQYLCHDRVYAKIKDQKELMNELPAAFRQEWQILKFLPLVDLGEYLIRIFNIRSDVFVVRFQDALIEFTSKYNKGLAYFLEWWMENENKIKVSIPDKSDAIRVLTIHKSKGLQFPVVIIPFAEWSVTPQPGTSIRVLATQKPFDEYDSYLALTESKLKESYFEHSYQTEINMSVFDNINLLYVAFTRAETRLYVFSSKEQGRATNISSLITETLQHQEFQNKTRELENWSEFISGKREKYERIEQVKREDTLSQDNFISGEWRSRLAFALNKDLISSADSPSALQGLEFHKMMSEIITGADTGKVFQKFGIEQSIREQIIRLIDNCNEYEWFTGKFEVKTECPLLLTDGRILRPDRLMFSNNRVTILDYKTGTEKPEHEKQLSEYAATLQQAGFIVEGKYIYYIPTQKLMKIE